MFTGYAGGKGEVFTFTGGATPSSPAATSTFTSSDTNGPIIDFVPSVSAGTTISFIFGSTATTKVPISYAEPGAGSSTLTPSTPTFTSVGTGPTTSMVLLSDGSFALGAADGVYPVTSSGGGGTKSDVSVATVGFVILVGTKLVASDSGATGKVWILVSPLVTDYSTITDTASSQLMKASATIKSMIAIVQAEKTTLTNRNTLNEYVLVGLADGSAVWAAPAASTTDASLTASQTLAVGGTSSVDALCQLPLSGWVVAGLANGNLVAFNPTNKALAPAFSSFTAVHTGGVTALDTITKTAPNDKDLFVSAGKDNKLYSWDVTGLYGN